MLRRKLSALVLEYIHLASDRELWSTFTRFEGWNDGKTITIQITTAPRANRWLWDLYCWAIGSDGNEGPAPPIPTVKAVPEIHAE